MAYLQVELGVIAEIEVDAAYEHHRWWRHQVRFLRLRTDMSIFDVPLLTEEP